MISWPNWKTIRSVMPEVPNAFPKNSYGNYFPNSARTVVISLREMWPSKTQTVSGYISRSEMATIRK